MKMTHGAEMMNPPTSIAPRPRPKKTQTNFQLIAWKHLITLLATSPHTQTELIEKTGLQNSTISRWLGRLHTSPNLVYISGWRRVGTRGKWSAEWSFGFLMTDVPAPPPKPSSLYNKLWRQKKAREARISQPQPGVIRHVSD